MQQMRLPVVGVAQRRLGGVAIDVESQPEHSMRLVELDVFRRNGALFTGNTDAKMQIVRKVQ